MWTTRREPYASPWGEAGLLQKEMNRLFETFGVNGGNRFGFAPAYPAMNVWEEGDAVYAEAELPGIELDDLEIFVTGGNQLTLKGERKLPKPEKGWHRQERGCGTFARVISLPFDVDAEKVEAEFAHGVLTVKLPKSERAKPRKISVKS